MPKPLEALERDVLDYLVDYVRTHTYQPSVREIGAEFGIKSTKTVSELLQSLAEKGWVERESSRSRGVRLLGLDLNSEVVSVPHVDLQGDPSLENPLSSLTLDRRIAGTAGAFLVTMVGDGMLGEGIRDGDLLLVEPVLRSTLADGELVVCRRGGETGVWRLRSRETGQVLVPGPDRPVLEMEEVGADQVLGRVTAVVRQLRTDRPMGREAAEGRVAAG